MSRRSGTLALRQHTKAFATGACQSEPPSRKPVAEVFVQPVDRICGYRFSTGQNLRQRVRNVLFSPSREPVAEVFVQPVDQICGSGFASAPKLRQQILDWTKFAATSSHLHQNCGYWPVTTRIAVHKQRLLISAHPFSNVRIVWNSAVRLLESLARHAGARGILG